MTTKRLKLPLILLALIAIYLAGVLLRPRLGLRIMVDNLTAEPLQRVQVAVVSLNEQAVYRLESIPLRSHDRVFVKPLEESHIDLAFVDSKGVSHRETVVGYAEAGDCSTVNVEVLPGNQITSRQKRPRMFCWNSWLDLL
jgi:hypothetical protein